jgi:tetratricopeptide (TPR) repeat protein
MWYDIGLIYFKFSAWEYSEPAFQNVLEIDPNYTKKDKICNCLGEIYMKKEAWNSAIEYYETITTDLLDKNGVILEKLGTCHL